MSTTNTSITVVGCESCGYQAIPPKYTCPSCYSALTEREASGTGTIYSYTTIHVAPGKFASQLPYAVILVEFDHGLRVTARLEEGEDEPQIGRKVQLSRVEDSVYWFRGA
jgi:uncharacterized OB-fold protein